MKYTWELVTSCKCISIATSGLIFISFLITLADKSGSISGLPGVRNLLSVLTFSSDGSFKSGRESELLKPEISFNLAMRLTSDVLLVPGLGRSETIKYCI